MNGYAKLKYKHYLIYKKFWTKYPWEQQRSRAGLDGSDNVTKGNLFTLFRNGKFKVRALKEATDTCNKILAVGKVHGEYPLFLYKGRPFVNAMLKCFKNKDYNHKYFLRRLSCQKTKLVKCSTWQEYITLIQSIYNYRTRQSNKVALNL